MKKKIIIAFSIMALSLAACGPTATNEGGGDANVTVEPNNVESETTGSGANATGGNFRDDMINAMDNVISNDDNANASGGFRNDMVNAMDNVINNDPNGTGNTFRDDMVNAMDNVISDHNDVNVTGGSFRDDMINAMDGVMGR